MEPSAPIKKIAANWKARIGRLLRFDIEPAKQWRRLAATAVVLAAALIAVHLYLFRQIRTGTFFAPDTAPFAQAPEVNQNKLNAVIERFNAKASAEAGAAALVPAVLDPSK